MLWSNVKTHFIFVQPAGCRLGTSHSYYDRMHPYCCLPDALQSLRLTFVDGVTRPSQMRVRWVPTDRPTQHGMPHSHRAGVLLRNWWGSWRAAGFDVGVVVCGWRSAWTQQVGMVSRSRHHTDAPTKKPRATSTTSQSGGRRSADGLPGRQWHLHLYCLQSTLLHHTEGEVRSASQVAICHENTVVFSHFYTMPVPHIVVWTQSGYPTASPFLHFWGQVTIYTETLPSSPSPAALFCWSDRAILDRYELEPGGARETSQGTRVMGASVPYGRNSYDTQH
jgi:hypothetical protein